MAVRAESSRLARAMAGFEAIRLRDDPVIFVAEGAGDDSVPRSIVGGDTAGGTAGSSKGKERERDAYLVEEPLMFGEVGPQYREIEDGITMCCTTSQASPFKFRGKFFYAVHFDEDTFVDNVVFDNCVLINVSFRGCMLSDVRFINVYLHDMEFISCDFNDYTWLSHGVFNETWRDQTFEKQTAMGDQIPFQVSDPEWLVRLMGTQELPDDQEVLIHQYAGVSSNSNAPDTQESEPGVFNFSTLGNKVYESYNGALDEVTRQRRLAEWKKFGEEQEAERQRENAQAAEAVKRAIALSSREAASSARRYLGTLDKNVHGHDADGLHAAVNGPGDEPRKAFADLYASKWSSRPPVQATSGNVQQVSLPPHLRGRTKAIEIVAPKCQDDDFDDELDEPVYRPGSRFLR